MCAFYIPANPGEFSAAEHNTCGIKVYICGFNFLELMGRSPPQNVKHLEYMQTFILSPKNATHIKRIEN